MAIHTLLARLRQPSITLHCHLLHHAALKNVEPAVDDSLSVFLGEGEQVEVLQP
jgi:hypothetical protein